MLQVSLTLDTSKCRNLSASGATIANAGGDKLVTFTVMPGDSAVLSITADVTDFSMQGIEFAALPMSLDIDTPDTEELTDDLGDLSEAIGELNDAAGELFSGSSDLKDGAEDLKDGSSSFQDGLGTLNDGSGELITGSSEVMNALVTLSASLDGSAGGLDVAALAQLPDTLDQLSDGVDNISAALTDLDDAFGPAYAALDAAIQQIPDAAIPQEALLALYQTIRVRRTRSTRCRRIYAAGAETKATYEAVKEAFDAVGTALGQSAGSLDEISGSLTTISEMIRMASEGSDAAALMLQLTEGLKTLSANYELLHAGLVDYTSGVSSLAHSYGRLDDGLSGVAGGIGELNDGLGQLYDGTTELSDETKDIPEQVDDEIQELIGEYDKTGFVPPSFVSVKNTNTVSVQFVLKTDKIEKADSASAVPRRRRRTTPFWDRPLALFR
jgi:X-X-X-Leu-X-X-Gly heptad repeat protein